MWFKVGIIFIKLLSYVPFFVLYGLSSVLSYILVKVESVRKVPMRNFFRVFPMKNDKQLKSITYKYLTAFIDYFVEFIKFTSFSKEKAMSHCCFSGLDVLERLVDKHGMVLCYSGHFVNFEIFTLLPLYTKDIGMCHLYLSTPSSKWLDWLLNERSKYGAINIPSKSPLKKLLELRSEVKNGTSKYKGYIFGSLSDMDPKHDDKHSALFLGHRLEVKTGAEKIARKMGMGFCYAHIKREKRGYYKVDFREIVPDSDPLKDAFAYTDEFVHQLELNVLEQPEIWMQWGECRF